MAAMPGLLVLLRHAQSEWNAEGLWQGQADPELSPEGRRQASAAAKALAATDAFATGTSAAGTFDCIFSSDLSRAVQTAAVFREVLGLAGPIGIDPGLREYDVGEWSGKTREEIEARWPGDIARFGAGKLAAPPGGETRDEFDSRVLEAAGRVARSASASGSCGLLVVAHGGVVRALARLAGVGEYRVGHLAGYRGRYEDARLVPEEPIDLLDLELATD